jgi:Response regulator containing CheY-like receiver, AAA-type ATPase, and DNA-binding domains
MRVALLDDEEDILGALSLMLEDSGAQVSAYASAPALRSALAAAGASGPLPWDAALIDLTLPGDSGLAVIRELASRAPEFPVAVVSGTASAIDAVAALRAGAREFFEKPPRRAPILAWLSRLERDTAASRERDGLVDANLERYRLVGGSSAMERVRAQIASFASLREPVLVYGETGTGKELASCQLHYRSPRAGRPLSAVNAAALSETLLDSQLFGYGKGAFSGAVAANPGLVRASDGSSLFLDEIGELRPESQAKLLRILQDGMVLGLGELRSVKTDVRFIFATNRDLESMIDAGGFRGDLYYRIAAFSIRMPPLRERPEDIGPLAEHFLGAACAEYNLPMKSLSPEALDKLSSFYWPGNARELRSSVLNAAIAAPKAEILGADRFQLELREAGQALLPRVLAPAPRPDRGDDSGIFDRSMSLDEAKRELERRYILASLARASGSIPAAARELGIWPANLYRKLREHGIDVKTIARDLHHSDW